ncbi:MAG TPA: SAM-dependent methyltransferase [Prolixibacteraceae bacterium]|nr:SAM-dependent methyltransferase [Prolixibacteraceae bacterium]HPS13787.1 SAM-dependent methyltransferase [Prolixibacteraceae bacterium]
MIGKLYLIPTTLGDENPLNVLPSTIKTIVSNISHFVVEDERTARRFIKKLNPDTDIDKLQFNELNKRTRFDEMNQFLDPINEGQDIGIISEAGCPGVADPGADLVRIAHQKGIEVKPLVGPSSILLSLMASGMNGQSFAFVGYIPVKHPARGKTIRFLEHRAFQDDQTQIFIETPYRNNTLFDDLVKTLDEKTRLCIACDITLETEFIKTRSIREWKKEKPDLHKKPAIFLIGK